MTIKWHTINLKNYKMNTQNVACYALNVVLQCCRESISAEGILEKIFFQKIQETETNTISLDRKGDEQTAQHGQHREKHIMNLILSCLPSLWR